MLPETTSSSDLTAPVNDGARYILAAIVSFIILTGLAIFALTGTTYILTTFID